MEKSSQKVTQPLHLNPLVVVYFWHLLEAMSIEPLPFDLKL